MVLVLYGQLGGFWLVLLGWFLAGAATTEAASGGLERELEGVRVRELGAGDPAAGPGRELAVVLDNGRVAGVLTLTDLNFAVVFRVDLRQQHQL